MALHDDQRIVWSVKQWKNTMIMKFVIRAVYVKTDANRTYPSIKWGPLNHCYIVFYLISSNIVNWSIVGHVLRQFGIIMIAYADARTSAGVLLSANSFF